MEKNENYVQTLLSLIEEGLVAVSFDADKPKHYYFGRRGADMAARCMAIGEDFHVWWMTEAERRNAESADHGMVAEDEDADRDTRVA